MPQRFKLCSEDSDDEGKSISRSELICPILAMAEGGSPEIAQQMIQNNFDERAAELEQQALEARAEWNATLRMREPWHNAGEIACAEQPAIPGSSADWNPRLEDVTSAVPAQVQMSRRKVTNAPLLRTAGNQDQPRGSLFAHGEETIACAEQPALPAMPDQKRWTHAPQEFKICSENSDDEGKPWHNARQNRLC